jgi:hypothetical protein
MEKKYYNCHKFLLDYYLPSPKLNYANYLLPPLLHDAFIIQRWSFSRESSWNEERERSSKKTSKRIEVEKKCCGDFDNETSLGVYICYDCIEK